MSKAPKTPSRPTPRQKFAFIHRLNGDKAISFAAKVVAVELLTRFRNNKTGLCNPGFASVAESAGCSQRTAFSAVSELKNAGWIAVESTHGGSSKCTNRYSFDFKRVKSASPLTDANSSPLTDAESAPVQDLSEQLQTSANEPLKNHSPLQGEGERDSALRRAAVAAPQEEETSVQICTEVDDGWPEFEQLWQRGHADDPAKVHKAYCTAITEHGAAAILASARRWAGAREPRYLPEPVQWLAGGWQKPPARRNNSSNNRKRSAAEVAAGLAMAASREEGGGW